MFSFAGNIQDYPITEMKWYSGVVQKGTQQGRTIGYPTINLSPSLLGKDFKEGVYACVVRYKNILYKGALFFGPRKVKNETSAVLEIHILHFDKSIYSKQIDFSVVSFIRPVENFATMEELQQAIKQDIAAVTTVLDS